ncbi:MAG: hypothetical protein ACP5IL_08265 [Syntrophobacteraceae bacterium]
MSKKIIVVLAMAMVLFGGAFVNASAENVAGPHFAVPACWSFACGLAGRAAPNVNASVPLVTPSTMGAVGY